MNQYEQRIGQLVELGLESDAIIGYHGTSIEAIQKMAQTGVLPAGQFDKVGIFFKPVDPTTAEPAMGKKAQSHYDPIADATSYAAVNQHTRDCITRLGISDEHIGDQLRLIEAYVGGNHNWAVTPIDEPTLAKGLAAFCNATGCDPQEAYNQLVRTMDNFGTHDGVIIALDARVADKYGIGAMKNNSDSMHVVAPKGMSIDCITGIEPVSQRAWDALVKYQE